MDHKQGRDTEMIKALEEENEMAKDLLQSIVIPSGEALTDDSMCDGCKEERENAR